MNSIRSIWVMLSLLLGLALTSGAQTTTQIADTVRNPDGTLFTGNVVITWTGASSPYGGNPLPYSTSTKVYNGVLSVAVVPTVAYSAYYLVVYNSADGRTSWVENWQVGPSTSALNLGQVRTALANAPSSPGSATLSMGQVTGLGAYLNAISSSVSTVSATVGGFNNTLASLSNTVSSLSSQVSTLQTNGTSSGSGTNIWVEGEAPSGLINGVNAVFTLAATPYTGTSPMIYCNGVLLQANSDYTVTGRTIAFTGNTVPQMGDLVLASYRTTAPSTGTRYVDSELPQGSNLTYTLSSMPATNSLRLYKNGALLQAGVDFTISGATITFVNSNAAPASQDLLTAYYRVTG